MYVHYILVFLALYLASIVLDQLNRGICGYRGTCPLVLRTFCDLSMQAGLSLSQLVTHVNCYCNSAEPT